MSEDVFIHPNSLVETDDLGPGTRVWAFAHVMKNVKIGAECNVGDHSFIESGVTIGDRVTIKNGVSIWEGVEVADDVFIGPNASFTNDLFPRSKVYHEQNVRTSLGRGCSIGANATIVAGVSIGEYVMIGAGAVVIRDLPAFALVAGNPSRQIGWVGKTGEKLQFDSSGIATASDQHYQLRDGIVTEIP